MHPRTMQALVQIPARPSYLERALLDLTRALADIHKGHLSGQIALGTAVNLPAVVQPQLVSFLHHEFIQNIFTFYILSDAPLNLHAQSQRRSGSLQMHPLLAATRLHSAPISYDILYTPSNRTVVDRTTHMAVPTHTLS